MRKLFANVGIVAGLGLTFAPNAFAYGPTEIALKITGYKAVDLCDGRKPIMPGQKAMEGLFPVCVEVEADVNNPKDQLLKDVSVYGFIKDDAFGNSVLPNNPDFKSDAGQYAMIKSVGPGKSHIIYQFVAAVTTDPKKEPLGSLTFFGTKAISYPGGDRFQALGECEIDPRADGCPGTEDD
ncbi:hypothetical protein B484DRAFT_339776 [Ochromonadaceae sp. CCMP2298]|nr:hypothetical protein B484DRAFT_339776 [Ochromonadaceae sp. CCMP2298]